MVLGDFWGTKREEAMNLFKRVQDGDQLAFEALIQRTKSMDPNAAMQLGFVLQTGTGSFPKTDKEAETAYMVASGKIKEADFNLGLIKLKERRIDEAVSHFEKAAGKERDGLTNAMVNLGKIYEAGLAGAPRSASLAAEWYEYAANAGDLYARQKFGMILLTGRGRPVDVKRGVSLVENAALLGDREARMQLARWYDAPPSAEIKGSREVAAKWLAVASDGSPELQVAAENYRLALTERERKNVDDAVSLWRVSHPPVRDAPNYSQPMNLGE
jgi:TPR repeat protein